MKDTILQGDVLDRLRELPDESVDCVITSPPYWALRDYGVVGQFGLEPTFQEYITKLCDIFDEVKRVLKKEGTCWVNIGDTYGGTGDKKTDVDPKYPRGRNGQTTARNKTAPQKSLVQVPARFALEMTNRGWILRNEIIWHKPNVMPSSAKDRFTVDFEKIFFFTKSKSYYFETAYEDAVWDLDGNGIIKRKDRAKEHLKSFPDAYRSGIRSVRITYPNGKHGDTHQSPKFVNGKRIKRAVWRVPTKPFKEAHFATFPEALIETPIKAGCPMGGVCLDPFMGAGTTAVVAKKLGRHYLGIELNPDYIKIAENRISHLQPTLL